jgi:hypothetical protein
MYELQRFNNLAPGLGLTEDHIDFKGVDSSNYYGGRAYAAELISGGGNPLMEFAFELFSSNELPHTWQKWYDISYFDESGDEILGSRVQEARGEWSNAWECLQDYANEFALDGNPGLDRSMRDVMTDECDPSWDPSSGDPLKAILERYELDWEYTLDAEHASPFGNLPLYTYNEYQDKDWFITHPDNSAEIVKRVVEQKIGTDKTLLDTVVKEIIWDVNPVQVKAETSECGGEFTADKVRKSVDESSFLVATSHCFPSF